MSGELRLEPVHGMPEGYFGVMIICKHGGAQTLVTQMLLDDVPMRRFVVNQLEDNLHDLTGCTCWAVPVGDAVGVLA